MTDITQELLKEFLDYNPETGVLTWKERDRKWFKNNGLHATWNNRWADIEAGSSQLDGNGKRYRRIKVIGNFSFSHRAIWMLVHGKWPSSQIDHIDGNGENNKIENLRCVDGCGNAKNRRLKETNISGFTGVSWYKSSNKWVVHIGKDKKWTTLGYFKKLSDAVKARLDAEEKYNYHYNHGLERPL